MLNSFTDFINVGGLPLIFLLIFLEGNPIFGSFVPGHFIAISTGFFISATNIFSMPSAFLVIFIAGFLGDFVGYYMGKKFGKKSIKILKINNKSPIYKSSCDFFKKYGAMSIILGREIGFARSFIPFFAGMFKMSVKKFVIFAIISNLIWTSISLYLGYYFGMIVVKNFEIAFEFILILIIYLAILFYFYNVMKKFLYQNFMLVKYFALHNILYIGILTLIIVIMIFTKDWGYHLLINDIFVFAYFPSLIGIAKFIFSFPFLFGCFMLFMGFLAGKKEFKKLITLLWVFSLTGLLNILFSIFANNWFSIKISTSVVYLTVFLFMAYMLLSNPQKPIAKKKYSYLVFAFLILFVIILRFSSSHNFFETLFSFFISALVCEIILLLSHYKIISKEISETFNSEEFLEELLSFKK